MSDIDEGLLTQNSNISTQFDIDNNNNASDNNNNNNNNNKKRKRAKNFKIEELEGIIFL